MKSVGKEKALFSFFYFLAVIFLLSGAKEPPLPVFKGGVLLAPARTRELNSLLMRQVNYRIPKKKGPDEKAIEAFYTDEFAKQDYKRIKCENSILKGSALTSMTFLGKKLMAEVLIENKKGSEDIMVHVSVMDNRIYYDKEMIGIKGQRDNPGFDIPDIPRGPGFIRIVSMKIETEEKVPMEQVTYKLRTSLPALRKFYEDVMPVRGWTLKNVLAEKGNAVLFFAKKKRHCDIMLFYHPSLKQNVAVIQTRELP